MIFNQVSIPSSVRETKGLLHMQGKVGALIWIYYPWSLLHFMTSLVIPRISTRPSFLVSSGGGGLGECNGVSGQVEGERVIRFDQRKVHF